MESIFLIMKSLHHNIARHMEKIGKKLGISGPQFMVLNFLLENEDKDIYQKDLENHIGVRGATVTGIIQNLVNSGYIERVVSKTDARKKKLVLCAEKKEEIVYLKTEMEKLMQRIENGITDDEKQEFSRIVLKVKENLRKDDV